MMKVFFHHADLADIALLYARMIVGLFFILARFRWIYDPSYPEAPWFNEARHAHLANKLEYCGLKNGSMWAPFVAWTELTAAAGLMVGLLTPLAALGLLAILIRATLCTGKEKTLRQNPIDRIDVCSCYLWCPEPIYIALVFGLVAMGAGRYSLDAVVMAWLG